MATPVAQYSDKGAYRHSFASNGNIANGADRSKCAIPRGGQKPVMEPKTCTSGPPIYKWVGYKDSNLCELVWFKNEYYLKRDSETILW